MEGITCGNEASKQKIFVNKASIQTCCEHTEKERGRQDIDTEKESSREGRERKIGGEGRGHWRE